MSNIELSSLKPPTFKVLEDACSVLDVEDCILYLDELKGDDGRLKELFAFVGCLPSSATELESCLTDVAAKALDSLRRAWSNGQYTSVAVSIVSSSSYPLSPIIGQVS
jgi:hypothetical protein